MKGPGFSYEVLRILDVNTAEYPPEVVEIMKAKTGSTELDINHSKVQKYSDY